MHSSFAEQIAFARASAMAAINPPFQAAPAAMRFAGIAR
jgi:hypothetical protein